MVATNALAYRILTRRGHGGCARVRQLADRHSHDNQGLIHLTNLVTFWQVGIEIMFTVKAALVGNLAVSALPARTALTMAPRFSTGSIQARRSQQC